MVRPPSREAEDARRLGREREALLAGRIRHPNRIKGLLATQGVLGFEPTGRDRRTRLAKLRTPEGAARPPPLLAELGRLELAMPQPVALQAERDAAFAAERVAVPAVHEVGEAERATGGENTSAAVPVLPGTEGLGTRLLRFRGVGPESASVLAGEAFFRDFRNRREVASYAGLASSPWQSGSIDHEQGISKAGNHRVRRSMGRNLQRFRVRSTWKAGGGSWLAVAAQPAR